MFLVKKIEIKKKKKTNHNIYNSNKLVSNFISFFFFYLLVDYLKKIFKKIVSFILHFVSFVSFIFLFNNK
jgi:hypothetical protein